MPPFYQSKTRREKIYAAVLKMLIEVSKSLEVKFKKNNSSCTLSRVDQDFLETEPCVIFMIYTTAMRI